MKPGEVLWKKYCSFFDKDFSEQLEQNEKKKEEYFKKWKNTKMAKLLCPHGVEKFEDVPLTSYEDYPILHEFGKKMNELCESIHRKKGELCYDYYNKIGKQAAAILDGWLPDDYAFPMCTGGTTGAPKWIPHGTTFSCQLLTDAMRTVILACSEDFGETNTKPGENLLNVAAPIPYTTGWTFKCFESEFNLIPPLKITDNIKSVRKKVSVMLKMLKRNKVSWLGGTASFLKLLYYYFMNPQDLYKEYYESTGVGLKKFILYLMWQKSKKSRKRYKSIHEILPLKGIMIGGVGTRFYADFIKEAYEIEPLVAYGSAEGLYMLGLPHRRMGLHPVLDGRYFEFLNSAGEIKKINELKKDRVYEVIGTTFHSILARYRVGDILRVVDIRDDGMPIFEFESRKTALIDIYGWFRITEAIAEKALYNAGLRMSDNWAVTKELEPKEHLLILMEKDWEYSEEEASSKLFNVLKELDSNFRNYVHDYKIKDASEAIKVKYLKKGAFRRYGLKMEKEGKPLSCYKPPKIIPYEKHEIAQTLMEV